MRQCTIEDSTGRIFLLIPILLVLVLGEIVLGSVSIPLPDVLNALISPENADVGAVLIVRSFRLPRLITAGAGGMALAISGLIMQTVFRNPLAGPFVLGVSSGAGLMVALQVLLLGSSTLFFAPILELSSVVAAAFGSAVTLMLIVLVSQVIAQPSALLILGLLFGYASNALIQIIGSRAEAEALQRYVAWTYGSFDSPQIGYAIALGLIAVATTAGMSIRGRRLDALMLGRRYAGSMGIPVRKNRRNLLLLSGILAGTTTALCGPIGFIGITSPHIARAYLRRSDHRVVTISTALIGAILAIAADLVSHLPGSGGIIPVNAVTALIGVPVVVAVLLRAGNRGVSV